MAITLGTQQLPGNGKYSKDQFVNEQESRENFQWSESVG